ncbi:LPS assembly protein LptD [Desulfobotulus sp. H1]|uniref:LPS assembly protein LptD n=1 Tax=Desulfobotulus pelophilus TaxID=2823377 RepID=A0ABT3N876_9BACT|nr:LPS assembly protein LptD [Desulfobotulus pelophilus]MCW7753663.1 LPS assembly protein LptD [Desulfobotulus pelophilus]
MGLTFRFLFFLLLLPLLASAQPPSPYVIHAERLGYDPVSGQYRAMGKVRIEREGTILTADRAIYNPEANTFTGEGNVVLETGGDRMTGERIHYNMEEDTGTVEKGYIFVTESQFRLRGRRIERTGEHTYIAEGAGLTACEGDVPDWEITASRIHVTLEGYGTLQHGAFRIKGFPVLYAPWVLFPAKTQRQSGLLIPDFSLSDRYGYEHVQPLYLVLSDSSDATFYYHFMEKGRDRMGLEYRKVWSTEDRLTMRVDGLKDSRTPETEKAPDYSGDRYWFRMKQNVSFGSSAMGFVDLDLLSDPDYMDDFKDGTLGYAKSNALFQGEFGRDLDAEKERTRTNRFLLTGSGEVFRMEGEFVWEDDVRRRSLDLKDSTVQRLPQIRVSTRRQAMAWLPLYHDFEAEGTYFHRIDGERGSRMDLAPRMYAPFRMGPFSAEPSVGLRQTYWYTENPLDPDDKGLSMDDRTLYDARFDLFTEIYRVFDLERTAADKIRHSIQPRLTFEFVPHKDQDTLPDFDDLDRIGKRRLVTYSLTQSLTARFPGQDVDDRDRLPEYREFLRLKVSQSYDIDKAKEDGETAFSDAKAELSLFPADGVRLFGDISWSPEEADWNTYSAGMDLRHGSHRFYAEHRYSKDVSASMHLRGYLGLTDNVGFLWNYARNMKDDIINRQDYGIRYNRGCWQLDLIYSDDKDDRKLGFFWTLTGLGVFEHSLGEERLP